MTVVRTQLLVLVDRFIDFTLSVGAPVWWDGPELQAPRGQEPAGN